MADAVRGRSWELVAEEVRPEDPGGAGWRPRDQLRRGGRPRNSSGGGSARGRREGKAETGGLWLGADAALRGPGPGGC